MLGVFKPKAIGIPDALKLLLDDFGEQRSRTVVRFKHPTHVDVHVILEKKWYFVTEIVLTYCEKKMF